MMSSGGSLEEELYEYYEEEVSVYDTGLSTIAEGENEDGSEASIASDEDDKDILSNAVNNNAAATTTSSLSEGLSDAPPISKVTTPTPYANTSRKLSLESAGFDLVSPPIVSQKIQLSGLSALSRPPSLVGNSPLASSKSLPSPSKQPKNVPLSVTHHLTGEDAVIYDDDDEYTFVSCSDTDSFFGDMSCTDLDHRMSDFLDTSARSSFGTGSLDLSLRTSSASLGNVSLGNESVGSSSGFVDFDTKKTRLAEALERRQSRKNGNLAVEVDGLRRKLRYELTRKIFKEQLQACRSKHQARKSMT